MHDCIRGSGFSSILETHPKNFPLSDGSLQICQRGKTMPLLCHLRLLYHTFSQRDANIYYQRFIMSSSSLCGRCGREFRLCGATRGFWCTYTSGDRSLDLISPVNTSKPRDSAQEFLEGFQVEIGRSLWEGRHRSSEHRGSFSPATAG